MSRRLYSSFQRSNHHQNESIKTKHAQSFQFCLVFAGFVSILLLNCRFVVGENHPHVLARSSGRKVIESPTKKQAELHMVLFARATQPSVKADQLKKKAFAEVPTDRKPAPVMDAETIRAGLKSHDKALYIKSGWIRDPFISIGPERKYYYLTGTQPCEGDPRKLRIHITLDL